MASGDFLKRGCSNSLTSGEQIEKVGEPLFASSPIFVFEMGAYPEAKALSSFELQSLYLNFKSWYRVAALIGSSEAFARKNACDKK